MSVGLTANCNCLHCKSSKLRHTFSSFPLQDCSIYTHFIHNYLLPFSPPAALKLYSITILYYYGLYRLYFFTHNAYFNFVPSLLGAGNWLPSYTVPNCTAVHILITPQAKPGSLQYLHFIREICKYYYTRTRSFPLSPASVTHFVPFKPSTASCMPKISFVILVSTNAVLLT